MSNGAILWDFDGTLAFHRSRWGGCFLQVLDKHFPHHGVTLDDALRALATGYPWDAPEKPHLDLCDPAAWWAALEATLAAAYRGVGLSEVEARRLAMELHQLYVNPGDFELYPDVVPVLARLRRCGWRHFVLSNRLPELRDICSALGFDDLLDGVINSAETGYEKPHPEAFRIAKDAVGSTRNVVMVGDNPIADVAGAEQAGITAVLVRTDDPGVRFRANDLYELERLLTSGRLRRSI